MYKLNTNYVQVYNAASFPSYIKYPAHNLTIKLCIRLVPA